MKTINSLFATLILTLSLGAIACEERTNCPAEVIASETCVVADAKNEQPACAQECTTADTKDVKEECPNC